MRRALLLLLAGILIAGSGAWAQFPITVRTGDDTWVTPPGGSTFVTFNTADLPPLPAGFFGPGSQPFNGTVTFKGKPLTTNPTGALGRADTLVTRLVDATFFAFGDSDTIPIQIKGLSLVSESPITVSFDDGHTELWNVKLTLSTLAPQPTGSMTIRLDCFDGGIFSSDLPVLPRFLFSRSGARRVLDCGSGACNATNLQSVRSCWQRLYAGSPFSLAACNVSPLPGGVNVDGNCDTAFDYNTIGRRDFLPGFDGCADPAGCTQCTVVEQHPDGAVHSAEPATGCQNDSDVEPVPDSTSDSDVTATACPVSDDTQTTEEESTTNDPKEPGTVG